MQDSLPRTAYIKMIDIWFMFCLIVPLFEVLYHALMDKLQYDIELLGARVVYPTNDEYDDGSKEFDEKAALNSTLDKKKKVQNCLHFTGMIGFPLMFTIFTIVYFLIGIYN